MISVPLLSIELLVYLYERHEETAPILAGFDVLLEIEYPMEIFGQCF